VYSTRIKINFSPNANLFADVEAIVLPTWLRQRQQWTRRVRAGLWQYPQTILSLPITLACAG
jgi:hypothetical protein